MKKNNLQNVENFIKAVVKGKNLKAHNTLEQIIKEKASKKIKEVLKA